MANKNSQLLLSVIIPTLNEESYLPQLLSDLNKQTVKSFEVLVVDGGSIDQTKKEALKFIESLRLKFIDSKKSNISFQKNLGAKYAGGKYLFFLDADFRVEKNTIEKIQQYILLEKKLVYLPFPKPSNEDIFYKAVFAACIKTVSVLHKLHIPLAFGPAIIMNKKLFERIGGFIDKISEDNNLAIKAHKREKDGKARLLPDVKVIYSVRRYESQGRFRTLLQHTLLGAITVFKGYVPDNFTKYKMGGHVHKN